MTDLRGKITAVQVFPTGTDLLEAAALGASELVVGDTSDFSGEGGSLMTSIGAMAYTGLDNTSTPPKILLAAPLSAGLVVGEPILLNGYSQEKRALVKTDLGEDGVWVRIPRSLEFTLADGIRDPDFQETIIFNQNQDGVFEAKEILAADFSMDLTYLPELQDVIEDVTPTEPPSLSPDIQVTGMPTSLYVRALDEIANTTTLEFHMSEDPGFIPGAGDTGTLVLSTNSRLGVINKTALDTDLVEGVTYYVRAIALNAAGAAAPSPAVAAQLNLNAIRELVAEVVTAGFVLAGAIEVGDITINSEGDDKGILIDVAGGQIFLPADSTKSARFAGDIETANLTSKDRLDIYQLAQLFGTMRAVNGITDPSVPPTSSTEWDHWADAGGAFPNNNSGLVESIENSAHLVTATNIFGGVFAVLDKSNGQQLGAVSMPANFYPTSMTRLGSRYYVLGSLGTASGSEPWVYAFSHTAFTTITHIPGESWRAVPSGFSIYTEWDSSAHYSVSNVKRQCIGTDGTNILLARQHTYTGGGNLNRTVVRILNVANGALIGSNVLAISSPQDMYGIFKQAFDFSASRFVTVHPTTFRVNSTSSQDVNGRYVEVAADNWLKPSGAGQNRGLVWDGTRFWSLDSAGIYWKFVAGHVNNSTIYGRYTWYDGNATGGTHETARSPSHSFTWQARAKFRVTGQSAPEADSTEQDAAKLVRIYAGTNDTTNCRLQHSTDLPVGQNHYVVETLDTVSAVAPSTTTFSLTGAAPGRLESAAEDATPESIWWAEGSGPGRMGPLRWDATGKVVPEVDWTTLTHAGTSGTLRYKVQAGTVWVEGSINFASLANAGTLTILTAANAMPAAYRPGQSLWEDVCRMNAGTSLGHLALFADGSMSIVNQSGAAATSVQFRTSYPVE